MFLFLVAGAVGAAWTIVPALLKARYELNEIITTLMMSFIGINLAQILVKGPFQDPTTTTPQTRAFDFSALLPSIPGTESMTRRWPGIHVGVLVAVVAAVVVVVHDEPHVVRAPPAGARRVYALARATWGSTCRG